MAPVEVEEMMGPTTPANNGPSKTTRRVIICIRRKPKCHKRVVSSATANAKEDTKNGNSNSISKSNDHSALQKGGVRSVVVTQKPFHDMSDFTSVGSCSESTNSSSSDDHCQLDDAGTETPAEFNKRIFGMERPIAPVTFTKKELELIAEYDSLPLSKKLHWFNIIYLSMFHLFALWGVIVLFAFEGMDPLFGGGSAVKWETLCFAWFYYALSINGIGMGAHRLWAHKSYQAHWSVRIVLALCCSIANEGSVYKWARDHRVHHRHSDTLCDPHSSVRGFFYSHCGWLLVKKDPRVAFCGRRIQYDDLLQDVVVSWAKYFNPWLDLFMCFVVPTFVCSYFFGDSWCYGFLFPGVLRYICMLQCTWMVNSVAHCSLFGPRTHDGDSPPVESRLVAFFVGGEGWHSYHHAYPFDYATAEFDCLSQFNTSKFQIDVLAKLGLAWGRKRGHRMLRERRRSKIVTEKSKELLENVENNCNEDTSHTTIPTTTLVVDELEIQSLMELEDENNIWGPMFFRMRY